MTQKTLLSPTEPRFKTYKHSCTQIMSIDFLSVEECETLIEHFGKDVQQGKIVDPETGEGVVDKHRTNWAAPVVPNNHSIPILDKLLQATLAANERYQFDLDSFESVQIAQYSEGEYYDWHKDIGSDGTRGNRKLSLIVQLSSPDSYEGGTVQVHDRGGHWAAPREQGTLIVFPSWELHRVIPVTKGERWSLVAWAAGLYRFR